MMNEPHYKSALKVRNRVGIIRHFCSFLLVSVRNIRHVSARIPLKSPRVVRFLAERGECCTTVINVCFCAL